MFIVKMSNCEIKIDKEEVDTVIDGVKRGIVKILKQGVFNPSFFVAIIPDTERKRIDFERECDKFGHYTGRVKEKALTDMFEEFRLETKKLNAPPLYDQNIDRGI